MLKYSVIFIVLNINAHQSGNFKINGAVGKQKYLRKNFIQQQIKSKP